MGVTREIWVAPAAVQLQEHGPDWLDVVDDKPWSSENGFHRGFCSSFRIRPERQIWFHFPFQVPVGGSIDQVSLLWETEEGAKVSWACVHHGGMERRHLYEPNAPLNGVPEPFDPPDMWRKFYPAAKRMRADMAVEPAISTRFGFQLCILVDGPGVVRFYGAGLRYTDMIG